MDSTSEQVILSLYGTGLSSCLTQFVTVLIGGSSLPAQFVGAQGQFPGVEQINVLLPPSLAGSGEVDLGLTACGYSSTNTVRLSIR